MEYESLVNKIKQKRELRGIADAFIHELVHSTLKKKSLSPPLSKSEEKKLVKEVRSQLRVFAGRFGTAYTVKSIHDVSALLAKHSSTRERMPFYENVRSIIYGLHPRSILDLGCGLNPLAIANTDIVYHAYDVRQDDIEVINAFFKKKDIKGSAEVLDIRKPAQLPSADLALLFKVIDLVDASGHKEAEALLKRIPCKHIIVSFSTKTLSGKPMNHPQRGWIERLSSRLGYSFHMEKIPNELFYVITKLTQ